MSLRKPKSKALLLNKTMGALLFLSLSLLSMIPNAKSDYIYSICPNDTVSSNSKYQANINTVLHSLSNATASNHSTGFHTVVAGNGTADAVYGLYLCRGDQNATGCRDCVVTTTGSDLPNKYCPNQRMAVIWYDECMVRYSNESLLGKGKMHVSPWIKGTNGLNTDGNQTRFTELTGKIMNDVAVRAAKGDRLNRKFDTEQTNYTELETVYGLAQCTPDLTENDCNRCLKSAIGQISNLTVQGARVLQPSCNIRYEIYPFYIGAIDYSQSRTTGKKKVSTKVIIAIVVPMILLLATVLICIYLVRTKTKKHDGVAFDNVGADFANVESLHYDLATLQSATNNFSNENKLGEGGFGVVYKGLLSNGQEIAVKRLSSSSTQGVQEFKNEVLLVAKLQHRNLVRLLGYCLAGSEKLLVYEYVPNKSLDYFLFDPEKQGQLDWGRRYKIIIGIARGMLYLHQDSRLNIIHRDLKASNILLDVDMNSKISDFGMAKIFDVDQTQGNTSKIVGTYGYMASEYAMHGQFSVKSDVYSFGVLVLEIISGKRNSTFYISGYAEDLLSYAWKQWKNGTISELVDPTIRDSCSSHETMRCIHLGLLCVQECVDEGPTMATIVLMLESQSTTLPIPGQPAFFTKSKPQSVVMKDVGSNQSTSKSISLSMNNVSISEIKPR